MHLDTLQGKGKQMVGDARIQWGELTDDDMTQIDGNKDKLVGLVQERYGKTRDEAQTEVKRFFDTY